MQEIELLSGRKISCNTKYGAEVYRRSLVVLLQCAMSELYPDVQIQIGQTLMNGYYFEISGPSHPLPEKFYENLTDRMNYIVNKNIRFQNKRMTKAEAVCLYSRTGRNDKVRAVSYLPDETIDMVFLRDYFDYVLTECISRTGFLKVFKIIRYNTGFVLQFPTRGNMLALPEEADRQQKLYEVYLEAREWNRILGVKHVPDLNKAIEAGEAPVLIKVQEAFHEKKIARIADRIKELYPDKKIIFIAGPSSSGKTTFLKRLSVQLRANGLYPENIHLDDYFVPRTKTPRTPEGDHDFESLHALDTEFFKEQINLLLDGKEVTLPKYDFKDGTRGESSRKLKLKSNSILLVEGIHGLNPELSEGIEEKAKFKIFVSALTQLCIDTDTRIFTSDSRLMRRIIRDSLFRSYSAIDTISRFPKVREGEDKYIFPYQSSADAFFNSSLIYEQAVLKSLLKKNLADIRNCRNTYVVYEAERLLKYLDFFLEISSNEIPHNSILREFIGESSFNY